MSEVFLLRMVFPRLPVPTSLSPPKRLPLWVLCGLFDSCSLERRLRIPLAFYLIGNLQLSILRVMFSNSLNANLATQFVTNK